MYVHMSIPNTVQYVVDLDLHFTIYAYTQWSNLKLQ